MHSSNHHDSAQKSEVGQFEQEGRNSGTKSTTTALLEQKGAEEQHANALCSALHQGWDAISPPSLLSWLRLLEAHPDLFLAKGGTVVQLKALQGLLSQWRELGCPDPEFSPLFLSSPLLPILREQNQLAN